MADKGKQNPINNINPLNNIDKGIPNNQIKPTSQETKNHYERNKMSSSNGSNLNANISSSSTSQTFKRAVENFSNDIYRQTDGKIDLATRDVSSFTATIVEQTGRYAAQGTKEEENYLYTNSKKMDKAIAVVSMVAGDYEQNKVIKAYDSVNFNSQGMQDMMKIAGYGTDAQDYAKQILHSSTSILTVTGSTQTNISSFDVSGKGMTLSAREQDELRRTGSFTRTVNGEKLTYTPSSVNGQQLTKDEVKDVMRNASQEQKRNDSILHASSNSERITAYHDMQRNVIQSFNKTMEIDGIHFNTGNKKECNDAIEKLQEKREQVLSNALGNVQFASAYKDIVDLNQKQDDLTKFALSSIVGQQQNLSSNYAKAAQDLQKKITSCTDPATKKALQNQLTDLKLKQRNELGTLSKAKEEIKAGRMTDEHFNKIMQNASPADKNKFKSPSKLKEELASKKKELHEIGDFKKTLDRIDKNIKDVNTYKETFTKGLDRKGRKQGSGKSNSKMMGARIVTNSVIGDDMMKGADFYRNGYKVAKASAKIAIKTGSLVTDAGVHAVHAGLNAGLKTVDKFTTGYVNDKVNSLVNLNDKANDKYKDFRNDRKELNNQKHSEDWKNIKEQRKEQKRNDKLKKRDSKKVNYEDRIKGLKNKGKLSKKDTLNLKYSQGRLGIINAKNWVGNKFSWVSRVRDKLSNIKKGFRNVLHVANTPFRFIMTPFHFLNRLKKKLIIIIMIVLGGFILLYMLLVSGPTIVSTIASKFVSAVAGTNLTDIFDNRNFVQIIVDDAAENLNTQLEKVCQTDAENHFLNVDGGKIESENYAWYKDVNEGEIRHIWAAEDIDAGVPEGSRKEVPALASNLLPITSMMHYRYEDEINFKTWNTARAYVYYMYVTSHNIMGYAYKDENDCTPDKLYAKSSAVRYNTETRTLDRPPASEALCSNIYYHGYTQEYSKSINQLRASADDFMMKAIAVLNESLPDHSIDMTALLESSGAFVDKKPSDAKGECDNYREYQKGSDEKLDLNDSCPGYIHEHTDSCHGGELDCSNSDPNHSHSASCYKINCGKEEHKEHNAWHSAEDPGCWQTVYVCQGHCGGHITPQVDIRQEMSFETLANLDTFKTTYFLTSADFALGNTLSSIPPYRTLSEWKMDWMKRFTKWFVPFPHSPIGAITYVYGHVYYDEAKGIDTIKNFLLGKITGEKEFECNYHDDLYDSKDEYGFDGWFKEDGTLDESIMEDLHDLYDTYENDYKMGYENWEEIGEVVFPVGKVRPLTKDQIQSILNQVKALNPNISEDRLKVIEEGLSKVGKFTYSLTGDAHNNGVYNDSGRSECSGFVSGVLYKALGATQYTSGWSASTYASHGHSFSTPNPGSILAHANGGQGKNGVSYTGHVVIYVGYLPDGAPGYPSNSAFTATGGGHYVIECTSGDIGGSVFRKIENIHKYSSEYEGCY